MVTELRQILSGRFFQIFWPSQNIQTLVSGSTYLLKLKCFFRFHHMIHWVQKRSRTFVTHDVCHGLRTPNETFFHTLPRNDLLSHYIGGHRSQWK